MIENKMIINRQKMNISYSPYDRPVQSFIVLSDLYEVALNSI
jgi:hypothetical protein